jgi:PAS domain S-box-containing protein
MNKINVNYNNVLAIFNAGKLYFENKNFIRVMFNSQLNYSEIINQILEGSAMTLESLLEAKEHVFNIHLSSENLKDYRLDVIVEGDRHVFELVSINQSIDRLITNNQMNSVLFQGLHMPVLLMDPVDGDIINVSTAAKEFYGYTSEGPIYQNIKYINQLSDEEVEKELKRADLGESNYHNYHHKIATGEIKNVEAYSNPILISGRQYLLSFILDISRREAGQQLLLEELKKYEMIFTTMSDSVLINEMDEKFHVGNFIEVNASAIEKLGYTYEEFREISIRDIDLSTDSNRYKEIIKNLKQNGRDTFEVIFQAKDGTHIDNIINSMILEHDDKLYLVSIARDISELNQLKSEKRIERNKMIKLLDNIDEAAYVLDDQSTILEMNKRAEEIFGYTRKESLGNKLSDLIIDNEMKSDFSKNLANVLSGDFTIMQGFRLNKQRDRIPVEVKSFAYSNLDSSKELVVILRDMSRPRP